LRYTFEWDPTKAKTNLKKHHISFERGAEVFLDPLMLSVFDEDHSDDNDERWVTLGKDSHEVVLVVVHTFQEIEANEWLIRIISARKATKGETRQYEEGDNATRI